MVQDHHDAGLVRAGVDLQIFADANKAGMIIALILHRGGKTFQAVQLRAAAAGQSGHILAAGLGNHFCSHRGVFHGNDLYIFKTSQVLAALVDGLLVGIDLPNVRKRCPGIDQKVMIYLQPEAADNGEIVLDH